MKGRFGDNARIEHIKECILEIETAMAGQSYEQFLENHVLRIAVVKWLEIIGEAANHISTELKERSTEIEWNKIISLRNIVVHEYFGINYHIIWEAATIFLNDLKIKIERINN
ncbi:hypothetical protein CAP35_05055 [Chitinophagaceae bacterium IBVUCB1]|nr:hypothetical protein CAP35_05055 [Chitinophagaceae bacterium IBVUCB1]